MRRLAMGSLLIVLLLPPVPAVGPPHPQASAGPGEAEPDFNGDGFADLGIAVVAESVGAVRRAGAVNVIYGSRDGLSAVAGPGNQLWTQNSPGILDVADADDAFGHVVATGDFNGDGFDELVIHAREAVGSIADAGSLNVIYGSPSGLSADAGPGNQFWTQDSPGIPDRSEPGDLFGRALVRGDFDGDGFDDIAVGVPDEDGRLEQSGVVHVLYGSTEGVTTSGNQLWAQNSPGILDRGERGDQFGRALTASDFNGDGFVDLAVGPRHETLEGPPIVAEAGAVNVIYGSPDGLRADAGPGNQFWTQDSPGIRDRSEPLDWWGRPLKAGEFNGDGFGDLAVGSFHEDFEGDPVVADAGAVSVIYGSPDGLRADAGPGNQLWTQDNPGILDQAESSDRFGRWNATGDLNGDGFDDLVLGSPSETLDAIFAAGAVNVIHGSPDGLRAEGGPGNQFWNQDSPDIEDQAESIDWFGHGNLVAEDFNGDGYFDLALGVIYEDLGPTAGAGAVNVIYGSATGLAADAGPGDQFWTQDSPGIRDEVEPGDTFGGTLASPGGD